MTRVLPYGTWPSPLAPAAVATASVGIGQLVADGETLWWTESRPDDDGRSVLVRWQPGDSPRDATPPPCSVRSRVYEYGGGAVAVRQGVVCFTADADQRLYRLAPDGTARAVTPEGPARWADGCLDPRRGRLIAVREEHGAGEPAHAVVGVALDGCRPPEVLVAGDDFYAAPRLSPDGSRLAWIAWRHPNMPWDGTELWVADLEAGGGLRGARRVAGGPSESVLQPSWSPEGVLHFVSDASGFWNLQRLGRDGPQPLCPMAAEFAPPPWVLGTTTYGFTRDGAIACAFVAGGRWRLGTLEPSSGRLVEQTLPFTEIAALAVAGSRVALVAGGPTLAAGVFVLEDGIPIALRAARPLPLPSGAVSVAEPVELPAAAGRTTYAVLHRPCLPGVRGPDGERPPLLVRAHGGPTAAASTAFDPLVQLWTSRGWAFLDVNYGGSTGYGRAYRARLEGQWGVVDVEDVVAAARGAAGRGWADAARLVVRGSSAGGFTALCALTFHDAFRAGSIWYGIADLATLAAATHKFESRYEARLVGPGRAGEPDPVRARSPLHHVERLRRPVLLLHGQDDRVVPPEQAETMAAALRARGVPVAHLTFPGEGHGFRRAASTARALGAELAFHATVLGLPLAADIEPIAIENWPASSPASE